MAGGNNAIPRHRRGLRDNYDLATHADVIYFATDTAEILLNGTVYGKGASAEAVDNVLRLLALKQDLLNAGQLIRIYTDTQGVLRIGTDRPMDNAVTPESTNFISSGAVYAAISAAEERINTYFRETLGLTPEQIVALNQLAQELEEYPDFVEGITALIQQKQDSLVSGTNIKTINEQSLLGPGNIEILGLTEQERANLNALMIEVFPLSVAYTSNNAGVREVGTLVTPTASFSATRQGSPVTPESVAVTPSATVDGNSWVGTPVSSGSVTYTTQITQGGQTKTLSALTWSFTYYRYRGAISSIPVDYASTIKALATKELSTAATLGSTALNAGMYYLFAVKGVVTLVCRHAATDGIIGGCVTGTVELEQENEQGTNTYSYILVPASSNNWNFKITNS